MNVPGELQRFEPFRSLGRAAAALLSQGLVLKRAKASATILHKGQVVSGAYVVLEGRLRVFTASREGAEATLYFIDPGEACVLALNCLFNDLLYPAWVQAETHAAVVVIPGHVYRRLFEAESTIQNFTVQALSTVVFRLMTELEQVHSSSHKQRLVQFILLHASTDGLLRMTQQQIARHLGTTREVIARLLRGLVAHGCVRTQRGAIAVTDPLRLRRMVAPNLP